MDTMQATNPIQTIITARKTARQRGIYSCCSANEYVLRAAMRRAKASDTPVLIESTANQVNQFGGYTGMRPADFLLFVERIAKEERFPLERLLLGGDHLGPLTWANMPEAEAMARADTLVNDYVLAGYVKIHLDTSMRLGDDDPTARLSDEVIASRGARLCAVAERAYAKRLEQVPNAVPPVYVIGSEVPIPGGATQNEDAVSVTLRADCMQTLTAFGAAFRQAGVTKAWRRVVALVVQPGVEFADQSVVEYDPDAAQSLMAALSDTDGVVFEGHSTDYQSKQKLFELVSDGVAILKVGPALTFALREGLFALASIENELAALCGFEISDLRAVMDRVMLEKPAQWQKYYHGDRAYIDLARAFSFSDRIRYYLPEPEIQSAIQRLLTNLNAVEIPLTLLCQYLPQQYAAVRAGNIQNRAEDLLIDHIGDRIDDYLFATVQSGETEANA